MDERLLQKYVIVTYNNRKKPRYLTDNDLCERNWSYDDTVAKIFYDLSAAQIKAANLRYGHHAVDAVVMYVTKDGKLINIRRNRYGRRQRV